MDNGTQQPKLQLIESVRCLECGGVYAKPAGGGTVAANPGCPQCGYLGWISLAQSRVEDRPGWLRSVS